MTNHVIARSQRRRGPKPELSTVRGMNNLHHRHCERITSNVMSVAIPAHHRYAQALAGRPRPPRKRERCGQVRCWLLILQDWDRHATLAMTRGNTVIAKFSSLRGASATWQSLPSLRTNASECGNPRPVALTTKRRRSLRRLLTLPSRDDKGKKRSLLLRFGGSRWRGLYQDPLDILIELAFNGCIWCFLVNIRLYLEAGGE